MKNAAAMLSSRPAAALVLIHLIFAMMAIVYGFDYAWPAALRHAVYLAASVATVAGFAAALGIALFPRFQGDTPADWMPVGAALCVAELTLTVFFHLPTRWAVAALLALWVALALLARWLGAAAVMGAALCLGFLIYAATILCTPFSAMGADMLPFITHALEVFLAGGDPYVADYSAITGNPFFYLPAQWLVFLPPYLLGIDLRIVNLLSAAAMVILVEWRVRAGHSGLRTGVYPLMLSPLVLPMMYAGQIWPYWLAILAAAMLLLEARWIWAAAALALAIGIRQTALVGAAAVVVGLIGRIPVRALVLAVVVGVGTLLLTILPFVSSRHAVGVILIDGPAKALALANAAGNPADQIASSNLMQFFGLQAQDLPAEALLGLLAMLVARAVGREGVRPLLIAAGLGYALTISANPYLFRYYYIAGVLLATIGLTAQHRSQFTSNTQ
jgi:hypothetical protein